MIRKVRERERERADGCSSVGKNVRWRPEGYVFKTYISQWYLVN